MERVSFAVSDVNLVGMMRHGWTSDCGCDGSMSGCRCDGKVISVMCWGVDG